MSSSPFHKGERAVQARLGLEASVASWAHRAIQPRMPDQHRRFFEQLPFVVMAARDEFERPWATILAGEPGFITSLDSTKLELKILPPAEDALSSCFQVGTHIGLLGIELETRRRNRVNGHITHTGNESFRLEVSQSFGNCPRYITQRSWVSIDQPAAMPSSDRFSELNDSLSAWITDANTFFIATGYNQIPEGV